MAAAVASAWLATLVQAAGNTPQVREHAKRQTAPPDQSA
jgi:hypothetical protein